jgi:hypothetical protein
MCYFGTHTLQTAHSPETGRKAMRSGKWMALAAASLWLAGCGGGGGGSVAGGPTGASQTPGVAVGTVTAFGSVFVNGVEFDTSKASFNVRGASASGDGALSVGMVVRVKGGQDDNGHGTATEIRYDAEIDGPVSGVTVDTADATIKHFKIFGQDVLANATTVFKAEGGGAYAFADLANGDHVEVSGDFNGTVLVASFIEKQAATDLTFEVKGTISGLNATKFVLTLKGGSTLNVTLDAGVSLPTGVQDGSLVELHGTIPDATKPLEFLASRVGVADHDEFDGEGKGEHEDHADLGGVLALDGTTWSIRGTTLKFSSSTQYRPSTLAAAITDGSAAGLRVHVRGAIVDGVFNVDRIRADGRADGNGALRLEGLVQSVNDGSSAKSAVTAMAATTGPTTITMSFPPAQGTIDVVIDAQTLMMDDDKFTGTKLSSLVPGVSFIQVRAHVDTTTGAIVANSLHIEDHMQSYEVSGPVDTGGYVAGVSISVLGVKFSIDASTKLMGGTPDDKTFVDVKDADRNGFADTIGLEDHHGGDFARPDSND